MAMSDLRALFQRKLLEASAHVYFGTAPSSVEYPCIVWNLQELAYEDGLSLQELETDVMDYGEDTAPAEAIADDLQKHLDHFQTLTDAFEVSVYRERRQPLQENDKLVIRRRLTFQVRLYERS